ncbi:MAG: SMP-30/gluconolactonase/LRE family protein [Rhodopirellula sp. JB055]|uniref:SMP-30/gluconolactonase/LRE family protein n=1 Tax=Rhodopirellula sp. JB055 TaxID=3342846 RepID=UPI00370C30E6
MVLSAILGVVSAGSALAQDTMPSPNPAPLIFAGKPTMLQEHGAGEGPAWHPEKGLFTSGEGNINLRSPRGEMSVYQTDSGSNGLMFDREGRLIVCEAVRRRIVRVELDGSKTVLADGFDGMKFNQPNDLSVDSVGRIYFTDPQYGDRSNMELVDEAGKHVEGVYRIDLDGTVSRIIAHEVDRPNGLVVTADDRLLFVADNNNGLGGARKLWRFNLKANGSVDPSSQTLVHDWGTTRGPDGMKLDQQGRLYVAAGLNKPHLPQETAEQPTAGIYVFSPEGKLLDCLRIPRDETTNCAFGGDDLKTLFVTAGGTLWSVPTKVAGAPVFPLLTGKPFGESTGK